MDCDIIKREYLPPSPTTIQLEDDPATSPEESSGEKFSIGRWTVGEHELFLLGLKKHGRNWKMIQGLIKTRSATQVRTHAQKFFTRDKYQANKRGRYASRLKDIETPDMMELLRASGALSQKKSPSSSSEMRSHSLPKRSLSGSVKCRAHAKEAGTVKKSRPSPPGVKSQPGTVPFRRSLSRTLSLEVFDARHQPDFPSSTTSNNQLDDEDPFLSLHETNGFSSSTCRKQNEVMISVSDAPAVRHREKLTATEARNCSDQSKEEFYDLARLVEPIEFLNDIYPPPSLSRTSSAQNEEDCLDWLASQGDATDDSYYTDMPQCTEDADFYRLDRSSNDLE